MLTVIGRYQQLRVREAQITGLDLALLAVMMGVREGKRL
jgi:hypothetical protein